MMAMFIASVETLRDGLQSLNAIISDHTSKRTIESSPAASNSAATSIVLSLGGVSWSDDSTLKHATTELKNNVAVVSHTCVKLALLLTSKPRISDLESIANELHMQLKSLLGNYFLLLQQSLSEYLFDTAANGIRSFLQHTQDLLIAIQKADTASINYMTGMVTKISEELQKIPATNRVAYRRHIMKHCLNVKETVDEFQRYLDEAADKVKKQKATSSESIEEVAKQIDAVSLTDTHEKASEATGGMQQQQEEEDVDSDGAESDGSIDYTPHEISVVEKGVSLMQLSLRTMKLALNVTTEVCDNLHIDDGMKQQQPRQKDPVHSESTLFEATEAAADTLAIEPDKAVLDGASNDWVALVAADIATLTDDIIHLGSELYPPFGNADDMATVCGYFADAQTHLSALTDLLLFRSTGERLLQPSPVASALQNLLKEEFVRLLCTASEEAAATLI